MSARTRTRPAHSVDSGMDVKLSWWVLALPVLAFVALLLLLAGPADADVASGGSGPVAQAVELVHRAFGRAAP